MSHGVAVRRVEIRTADREQAVAAATAVAQHRPRITVHDRARVEFQLTSACYDDLGVHTVRFHGLRYAAQAERDSTVLAGVLHHGRIALYLVYSFVTLLLLLLLAT